MKPKHLYMGIEFVKTLCLDTFGDTGFLQKVYRDVRYVLAQKNNSFSGKVEFCGIHISPTIYYHSTNYTNI
jgi:hypothetical protein